ncbi:MAG TPA: CaiB/BaiF CoA-transferase family protein [Stellaceae bacterium]|jgi:crotonobetainyl-CoA:carnitine CoA-transferase CaiB-like acyl-CoA transferase
MGPLAGIKIVELAGIGPGPMCAMLLADLGATVLRIERPGGSGLGVERPRQYDFLLRGRYSIEVDLKATAGKALALNLVDQADALIEGFRPGVTERLGLGPRDCLARNPRLVYGRVTGWGQDGALAQAAGHDINYIALVGALHAFGQRGGPPTPPLNVLGDFAGGALYLAFGLVCGILEARQSGRGQIVDAAMIDGVASLMTAFHGLVAAGQATHQRGTNHLDGGAHFYNAYECADGRWIAVAPIEGKFYAELLRRLDIDPETMPPQMDREHWPQAQALLAARFKTRTREEWRALLEGTDACFAPVLTTDEAPDHPHNAARGTYVEIGGIVQPAPAPRFSRTRPDLPMPPPPIDPEAAETALAPWLDPTAIAALRTAGTIG